MKGRETESDIDAKAPRSPVDFRLYGDEIGLGMARVNPHFQPDRQIEQLAPFSEDPERRIKLAGKVQKVLAKSQPANNRLSLPKEKRPSLGETLGVNLLRVVDEETRIMEIFPQSGTEIKNEITENDPLWGPLVPLLTRAENLSISRIFKALKRFYLTINANQDQKQERINAFMKSELKIRSERLNRDENATFETVGDLRKLSLRGWFSISGIGIDAANLMFEAFKKVEIPAE